MEYGEVARGGGDQTGFLVSLRIYTSEEHVCGVICGWRQMGDMCGHRWREAYIDDELIFFHFVFGIIVLAVIVNILV